MTTQAAVALLKLTGGSVLKDRCECDVAEAGWPRLTCDKCLKRCSGYRCSVHAGKVPKVRTQREREL